MRLVTVREHGRLERAEGPRDEASCAWLSPVHYDRLRRADRCREEADAVFDWRDGHARARQWVGVVQVRGAQVEVLPKIDHADAGGESDQQTVRGNLLTMLAIAGDVPFRERDLARLSTGRAPLPEALAALFAGRLEQELERGLERGYIEQEENVRSLRGRLVLSTHLRLNAVNRERFFVRHDDFRCDTPLGRVLKAACRLLVATVKAESTHRTLARCLALMSGVPDVAVHRPLLDSVVMTRQNDRFADLFRFARLLFEQRAPSVESGNESSFSLLFDMNRVFERFIAAFLARHVAPRLGDVRILPQAERHQRHLLERDGRGALLLRPDVLIVSPGATLVLDTKWKHLSVRRRREGVSEPDLYQLYAYARCFGARRSVLLYPRVEGVEPLDFDLLDDGGKRSGEKALVRFVSLHGRLAAPEGREALARELQAMVEEGLDVGGPTGTALAALLPNA